MCQTLILSSLGIDKGIAKWTLKKGTIYSPSKWNLSSLPIWWNLSFLGEKKSKKTSPNETSNQISFSLLSLLGPLFVSSFSISYVFPRQTNSLISNNFETVLLTPFLTPIWIWLKRAKYYATTTQESVM